MSTPRYQHIRFYKLNTTEDFFHGKLRYTKGSCFTGHAVLDGELVIVTPWRKVRSARPFGKPSVSHSVNLCASSVERPPVPVTPDGDCQIPRTKRPGG